ncbi:hypothetical protein [Sagittula salina]|uniref:Uncharacterized protein n=1 Tax=Sagittula salina TaxID=2820268 RepID=A0A940MTQ9_9RHOB|nr:hypothetical protein [Sagittula salina]MBP0483807.1 hypothetical protein [Sagittula salina]
MESEETGAVSPEAVTALFTREAGGYFCARWGRPIAPIIFGIEDETLAVVKGALEAVCSMAGHQMAETDPEQGTNLMVFFFRDWAELNAVPDLGRMVEGLPEMLARLETEGANQYRVFRFDANGAIRACFVFLRMDAALAAVPAEELALTQAVQVMLSWSEGAFRTRAPLALAAGRAVLRPDVAAVIRAAYDPVMPAAADDPSHALRLAARATLALTG